MHDFTPISALIGGALIGLASVWLLAANGRIAGVSGILHGRPSPVPCPCARASRWVGPPRRDCWSASARAWVAAAPAATACADWAASRCAHWSRSSPSWPRVWRTQEKCFAVTLAGFRIFKSRFELPTRKDIDLPLVAGSAIFGIGWGIAGYCPGPAITALSTLSAESAVFVAAMIAGGLLHKFVSSS